ILTIGSAGVQFTSKLSNEVPMAATRSDAEFSSERFRKVVKDFEDESELIYSTIRRLCADRPGHKEIKEADAKVWLIGRAYAAQIERKVKTDLTPGSALSKVVRHMHAHGREIDLMLNEIPSDEAKLTADVVPAIMRVHGQFTVLLKPLTSGQ